MEEEPEYTGPGPTAKECQFRDLCLLFEKIMKTSGSAKKGDEFKKFLTHWRDTGDKDFFPAMRLLLPKQDRSRGAYGIKEAKLANLYCDILQIPKDSTDGQKLLSWKNTKTVADDAGDFAAVAGYVLKERCQQDSILTVADVNAALDEVAMANALQDNPAKKAALSTLLRNLTALEQKWLIRIIIKELKYGFTDASLFKNFHPDAQELYNVCTDLLKVCRDLHSLDCKLPDKDIRLFSSFKPMLGDTKKLNEILKAMNEEEFYVETKYDGDRIMLHLKDGEFQYWSRNANDYTRLYNSVLTSHIKECFPTKVDNIILDGEMIGFDPVADALIPKSAQDVKTLGKSADFDKTSSHPCFLVFDIVFLNGKCLAPQPLSKRLSILRKAITTKHGWLEVAPQTLCNTKEQLMDLLNVAIDNREEGIMIKKPQSIYIPNERKNSGWIKMKPEYVDQLSDHLDLLIVGGYWGTGKRRNLISHFMLGALSENQSKIDPTVPVFHSFCKVGTGYTIGELKDLQEELKNDWKKYSKDKPPNCLILAPGFKELPDVYIDPRKSRMVQIKAAEIIPTDKFKVGYTLRFPRLEHFRRDKDWQDCITVKAAQALFNASGGRLTTNKIGMDHFDPTAKTSKRRKIDTSQGLVMPNFKGADLSKVEMSTSIFDGIEFGVILKNHSVKEELERTIASHGGTFTQNVTTDTKFVIADEFSFRVKNVKKTGHCDIVCSKWIRDCSSAKKLLPLNPKDMLFITDETRKTISLHYDQYGDSFTEPIATNEDLISIFDNVEDYPSVSPESIAEFESKYMDIDGEEGSMSVFRRCYCYFDRYLIIGDPQSVIKNSPLELSVVEVELYGGIEVHDLRKATHVICDPKDLSRVARFNEENRKRKNNKLHIVKSQWISESIEKKRTLVERLFGPII